MEKYLIIGYAVLLAFLFDGSKGTPSAEIGPVSHLSVPPVHYIYRDSRGGAERHPRTHAIPNNPNLDQ